MDRDSLYNTMAQRKSVPEHDRPYDGGNGRIDRCVQLMRQGKIRTGGTILDVGGSIGDLGYAVRDMFDRRITLDIAELPLKSAALKGNEIILSDVDNEGFREVEDSSVDVVVALDFIEHIVDPESFARECHRVLKNGGEVFINTPNIRFWEHIAQLWVSGKFPHTSGDREVYHGGHLAFFTYSDLREIFESNGFSSFPIEYIMSSQDGGYSSPPQMYMNQLSIPNQVVYQRLCLELGCPNLLYKAACVK